MTNYSSGHETNVGRVGKDRLSYSDCHIEVDNRLAWFLGRLDEAYGDDAFYVHLMRNRKETAHSYSRRLIRGGIMPAYASGIYFNVAAPITPVGLAYDLYDTVEANLRLFLKDKTNKTVVRLETAKEDFAAFWSLVGAEGDLDAALAEWDISHNATFGPPV